MNVPAEGIDEDGDGAAKAGESVDPELDPVPSQQGHAAKGSDNEKAEREAAMQIDPGDHDCRQQVASRPLQAFCIEDDAEQHGRRVGRRGEIDVRGGLERRIEQACGEHRDAGGRGGGAAAQAGGCETADHDGAAGNDEQDETGEISMPENRGGDDIPQPGKIVPLLVAMGERPGILQRDAAALADQVSGGQMPSEIIMGDHELRVREVVHACECDQEDVDPDLLQMDSDGSARAVEFGAAQNLQRVHGRAPSRSASLPRAPRWFRSAGQDADNRRVKLGAPP